MARLLVVSRSMALALRMADAHDVVEESVNALPDLVPDPSIDVIVLDVGEPSIAIATLDRLRSSGRTTPLLVVSGYQPAWAGLVAVDLPGVVVVPLPITRSALLDGIALLTQQSAGGGVGLDTALPEPGPLDTVPMDAALLEAARLEAARLEAARLEVTRREAARLEVTRRDAARLEVTRRDADRLDPAPVDPYRLDPIPADPVRLDPIVEDQRFDAVLLGTQDAAIEPARASSDVADMTAARAVDPGTSDGAGPAADRDHRPAADRYGPGARGIDAQNRDADAHDRDADLIRPFIPPVVIGTGWSEAGFEWWDQALSRRPPAPSSSPAASADSAPATRPLRRGWPPQVEATAPTLPVEPVATAEGSEADADLPAIDDSSTSDNGSGISPALRSAIESAIQANRTSTARAAAAFDEPAPEAAPSQTPQPPQPPPRTATSPSEELMARRRALLGRSADSGGASAFQRRLGGRKYQSSFGPGGTSADLIALGLGLDEPSRSDPTDAIPPDLTSTDASPTDLTSSDASPTETTGADPGAGPDSGAAQPQDTPAQEWTQEPGPPLLEGLPGPLVRPASASPAERQIAQHLVIELTDRIGDLLGVADTAHLLVQDVLEAAEADAVALLVPDGAVWRASGGIGLRAVERRMVLDGAHWLIEQVAHGGRIVALQGTNTEAARQRWAGAPLSAWRHLLAVPIPQVQAVVILARGPDSAPFADEQLSAIAVSLDGAGTALLSALQIRHLARLMDPLREVDPPPR